MKDLVFAAYRHSHVYSHSYGGGWSDWIVHTVLSSVVHAMIYHLVFRLMHRLTLGEAIVLVMVVLGVLLVWSHARDQRR
jgi:hypothetical protein